MILVISSKKVYAAKRLREEAGIRNIELRIKNVEDLAVRGFKVDLKKFDVLYIRDPFFQATPKYIPEIIKLAKQFKRAGNRVVDSVIANGELGQGKWADYKKLKANHLPIPKTSVIARSAADEAILFKGRLPRPSDAFGARNDGMVYPFVLKWIYGFKSQNVFLIENQNQLKQTLPLHPKKEWLVQEFIKAEYEYKVITVGYKVLPVVLRFKILDSGFRTDFDKYDVIKTPTLNQSSDSGSGRTTPPPFGRRPSSKEEGNAPRLSASSAKVWSLSSFSKEEYPAQLGEMVGEDKIKKITQLAELSSRVLKRELAKVDILEVKGKFYILEVNRFPGLQSFENLTNYNVTKEFLKYLSA